MRPLWVAWHQHRYLLWTSVRREIQQRYRGSLLGLLWSFVTPLLLLAVYTFVFSEVFQARWGGEQESKMDFALLLFAGLMVFQFFSEVIQRAPNLIISQPNYVKKVIFPLEILPIVVLISALYHWVMSLVIWLAAYAVFFGWPSWTSLLLPLVWLPFMLLLLGLSWFLAALGVYVRDVGQLIGVLITLLLFLSPIFYPVSALPEMLQPWMHWNPLTLMIEQTRQLLFYGALPDLSALLRYSLVATGVAWLGWGFFQATRRGFADVL